MRSFPRLLIALAGLSLSGLVVAQETIPLTNWQAPPFWAPEPSPRSADASGSGRHVLAFPSASLPFVAIAPCRVADTRPQGGFTGPYGPPFMPPSVGRDFTIAGQCGIPASALAASFNFTVTNTAGPGFLLVFPKGSPPPVVSTLNYLPNQTIANAAIAPLGTDGAITAAPGVSGFDLIIDVNGYYASTGIVNSLNTLGGDVTLSAGSNVTITRAGQALTIASTGGGAPGPAGPTGPTGPTGATGPQGPAGVNPPGAVNQTLRHNGSGWVASPALSNDGSSVSLTGALNLPAAVNVTSGGTRFIGSDGSANTFLGAGAWNPASTGYSNTALGDGSLGQNSTGHSNTGVGSGALYSNTTGSFNIAVGTAALFLNTLGSHNLAIGPYAMNQNSTAGWNTAVGSYALSGQGVGFDNSNTEWQSENTAVGFQALFSNRPTATSNGRRNTAVGSAALNSNSTGGSNTAVGRYAMSGNTTANRNTGVGASALSIQSFTNANTPWDSDNTAVGYEALYSNQPTAASNGVRNSALGNQALRTNTTGSDNVALGWQALYGNADASENTAVGSSALALNASGAGNTAVGRQALTSSNGSQNTAVGLRSLRFNSSGALNVAVGAGASYLNQTGSQNTAIGMEALQQGTGGSGNVALGYRAGYNESGSNRLHIANSDSSTLIYGQFDTQRVAIAATDPTVTLDVNGFIRSRVMWAASGANAACYDANGVLGSCVPSDARLKTNVVGLSEEMDVLSGLAALRGVRFDWNRSVAKVRSLGERREVGVIAQEVESVLPEIVSTGPDGYMSVDYAKLTAFLIEVAKAQQKEIRRQRQEIDELTALVRSLVPGR